jgi:DNA-binding FadR family transcriptional regulator
MGRDSTRNRAASFLAKSIAGADRPSRRVSSAAVSHGVSSAGRFQSIARQTLSRQAARALIINILLGHFRPGESLPSSGELARKFEVSRPVIREALKIVATLGMVESRQGRLNRVGERVAWYDLSHEILAARLEIGAIDDIIGDSLELRRVIEAEAAALAAERATEDDLAAMRQQLDALDGSSADPQAYAVHDVAFHDAVLRATHNRLFLQLIDSMRELLVLVRIVSITASADRIPNSRDGHRILFEAIMAKSPEAARKAMVEHLAWAERVNVSEYRAAHATLVDRAGPLDVVRR